jgi:hypothetical protein
MVQEIIDRIDSFLEGVTATNFSAKYDELAAIITFYNEKGLGKDTMIKILKQYYDTKADTLNSYQDEVLIEIICCVEGFCTPNKKIELHD